MSCPRASSVAVALSVLTVGATVACSAQVPPRPAGVAPAPPTPRTVTVQNPGGDASDPEWAALDRLAREPWGMRRDRTNTLLVPLADAMHWTRVRLWGYPTRAAFRFGDDHYGVIAIWYTPAEGRDAGDARPPGPAGRSDPERCLDRFLAEARPAAEAYGTRVLASHRIQVRPRPRDGLWLGGPLRTPVKLGDTPEPGPMAVEVVDAEVSALFSSRGYAGALAAYPSWPGTCLIQGFVVAAGDHWELASRIRDRWVAEGAARLSWHPRVAEPPRFDDR